MTPFARKAFVVLEREEVAESKTLHVIKRSTENYGRVISAGPDVVGLEEDALVVYGMGVQAEVGGYLYMRDDNVLAVIDEDDDDEVEAS